MAPVYGAAAAFVDAALKSSGDSLFTPGRPVFSLENCQSLHREFVEQPDESKDTFENKLRRQLADAPPDVVQLAGELLFFHFLAMHPSQMRASTKRRTVEAVLSWSKAPVKVPAELLDAFEDGFANTGQSFLTRRPNQLWFLIAFLLKWKGLSDEDRSNALKDPWAFKALVFSLDPNSAQTQQHALLHLIFPDTFESIASQAHKRDIVDAFESLLDENAPSDVDRQLLLIRAKLSSKYGDGYSYYSDELRSKWRPEDEVVPVSPEEKTSGLQRYWVEKTLVQNRPDRLSGNEALGRALWSPQTSKDGRAYYRSMQEVKPGDLILHFVDNQRFIGVSRAVSTADDTFVGLSGTEWADRPAFRIQLSDYTTLTPPIERESLFKNPAVASKLKDIANEHKGKGLFFNRDLDLNQGAYLTEAPKELVEIFDALCREQSSSGLPHYSSPEPTVPLPATTRSPLSMDWLIKETLWQQERLEELIDSIRSRSPQIILAGPPGTSKTWVAQRIARYLSEDRLDGVRTIQFHPSYSYEDFVEGLRPVVGKEGLQFAPVAGVIPQLVDQINKTKNGAVLIIDEMNRANLPRVFGELMYLLEYRDKDISLPYRQSFRLPSQLLLIGTMNTADRSIRHLDVALRRRFEIFECPPEPAILSRFYETVDNEVNDLVPGFESLNAMLASRLDRHHTIGHSFFMTNPMTADRLKKVWKYKIGPLLEEYFFDQPDLVKEIGPEQFWKSLA
jgi:5-methylcytosine-specific restriction enzyme B